VECVSSGSGSAALDRIRRGDKFDVVVCDVLMLGMTGPSLRANVERLSPSFAKSFHLLERRRAPCARALGRQR
jgi:CheY-like chemotaxis protein